MSRLNCQQAGQGPVLIMLHGLFGSLDNFRSVSLHMERSLSVLRMDLPGHGLSPTLPTLSIEAMADAVLSEIARQGVREYHLLGHSLGGKVAMCVAGNAACQGLQSLCVVDIAPRQYKPHHQPILDALQALDLQLIGDLVATGLAVPVAYWLRFVLEVQPVTKGLPPISMYLNLVPVVLVLYPVVFYFQGLYHRRRIRSRFDEGLRVVVAVLLATVILAAGLTFYRPPDFTYSRLFLVIFAGTDIVLVGLFRWIVTASLARIRRSGGNLQRVLVVGAGELGREVVQRLNVHREYGFTVVGFLDDDPGRQQRDIQGVPVLGTTKDLKEVVIGHNVDLGFYDQELTGVSDHNTVLAEMQAVDPRATLGEHRSFLGAFGFGEDLYDRQVSALSGGERGRLSLLRLIQEGHNTLLLDEPTNHLDIRSRESLEAALREFTGTMVVVSHDRRFLEKLVDRLLIFPPAGDNSGEVRVFSGSYADYVWKKNRENQAAAEQKRGVAVKTAREKPAATAGATGKTPLSKNEQKRRQEWINRAEEAILTLETEQEETLAQMGAPDLSNESRLRLGKRCGKIETELAEHMSNWELWSLEIEEGLDNA